MFGLWEEDNFVIEWKKFLWRLFWDVKDERSLELHGQNDIKHAILSL